MLLRPSSQQATYTPSTQTSLTASALRSLASCSSPSSSQHQHTAACGVRHNAHHSAAMHQRSSSSRVTPRTVEHMMQQQHTAVAYAYAAGGAAAIATAGVPLSSPLKASQSASYHHVAAPLHLGAGSSHGAAAPSTPVRSVSTAAGSRGTPMAASRSPFGVSGSHAVSAAESTPVRQIQSTATPYGQRQSAGTPSSSSTPTTAASSSTPVAAAASSFLTQAQRTTPNSKIVTRAPASSPAKPTARPMPAPLSRSHARFGGHAIATALLPPHPLQHRPLLVLDLDETLVHASVQQPPQFDYHFNVDMGALAPPVPVWVAVRPGAVEFLREAAALFEVAVFTASIRAYADAVVDALDPYGRFVHHRLYREHCTDVDGVFVKDLARLGRPLHRVAIVDNSPHAYAFHPENAIPILSWFDEVSDRELPAMHSLLREMVRAPGDSLYEILANYRETQQMRLQ